jgi:FG-GAP-like repeat
VGSSPNSIAVSDFNGDGKSDLAVIHAGKQVSIVIGNGDGSFGTPTNFELGVGVLNAESVIVGDFNGDGKFDVATANLGTDNISVLLAAKNGGFETSNFTNFKVGTLPNSIAVGDLNGDGKSDLVTANLDSTASVLLGNGDGSFGSATNIGVGGLEAKAVKIGDFDGDGKADLATANFSSNNISVLSGNGDGSFGTL